jgi:hypothetical protein
MKRFREFLIIARRLIWQQIIKVLAGLQLYGLLARIAALFVAPADGKAGSATGGEERCTILALDAFRFRGDLRLLAKHSDLRVLTLSWEFMLLFMAAFVPSAGRTGRPSPIDGVSARIPFHTAPEGSKLREERARYRAFLRGFLPRLFDRLGIELILTSDMRFRRTADFCAVASERGYPHMCLQRESMFMLPSRFQMVTKRHGMLGKFQGDIVAVQNAVTKDMFLASGNYEEHQVEIVGCPRMDNFLQHLNEGAPRDERIIAIFSAPHYLRDESGTRYDVIEAMLSAVRAAARIANRDPTVSVLIKMKDSHVRRRDFRYMDVYSEAIRGAVGFVPPTIKFITGRMLAHDVLLKASIIVAMQSTVALEAALTGKPVILPHLSWLRSAPYAQACLMYVNDHALFDVPATEAELEELLRRRLANPEIPEPVMVARRAAFERFVSPLNGTATQNSIDLIDKWVQIGRERRGQKCANAQDVVVQREHKRGKALASWG